MRNRNLILIGLSILVGVLLISRAGSLLNSNQTDQLTSKAKEVQLVNVATFSQLTKDQNSFLVDVHTPEQTHIPGTDAFIPFDQITENKDQLPQDLNTPILVYCRSGGMSKSATQEIASLGYTNVYDLDGGINAYREHNTEVAISPKNQDLGEVIYGEVAKTEFTFTNFTPMPLKITRVSTSCGCTSAEVETQGLEAYQSTKVKVLFDPAVHKDDTDLGNLTRTIYIETDNDNFPNLEVTITANVIKES